MDVTTDERAHILDANVVQQNYEGLLQTGVRFEKSMFYIQINNGFLVLIFRTTT